MPAAFRKPLTSAPKGEIALDGNATVSSEAATPAADRRRRGSGPKGTKSTAVAADEESTPVKPSRSRKATSASAKDGSAQAASEPASDSQNSKQPNKRKKQQDTSQAASPAAGAAAAPPASEATAGGDGDETSPAKRTRKPKPEGPYTKFKESGSIPEPALERLSSAATPGRKRFTAISWNVAGLRAFMKGRASDLQQVANQEKPDLIGILETKLQEDGTEETVAQLHEALPEYEVALVHCATAKKGYSGTAVLLRKDAPRPIKIEASDLPSAANEGRVIIAEYEALFVVICYVPNSGQDLKRLGDRIDRWDVELKERLKELAAQKAVLLLGDLNVAHRDEDIWNVEAAHVAKGAGTTPQERASFSRLLEAGFVDGFAHLYPEALGAFTYWSIRAGNRVPNRGLRLDYAVVSKGLVTADIDEEAKRPALLDVFHLPAVCQGDHCPVGAVLAF